MAELTKFQNAAVAKIIERFNDNTGSGRFLLADEVGLGKTMVAKEVIDKLVTRRGKRGDGFVVVYICANMEIAEQNRTRLLGGSKDLNNIRLTLLSLISGEIGKARTDGRAQLFTFTPGTSLKFGKATGIALERRLLLYLLQDSFKTPNSQKWRIYFKGGINKEEWEDAFKWSGLSEEFEGGDELNISKEFKRNFKKTLSGHVITDPESNQKVKLLDCLEQWVGDYSNNPTASKLRQRVAISQLRRCLATVSLDYIDPDLIILDEFQRFADILKNADQPDSLEFKLFSKRNARALILSATPYKMLTTAVDEEDHYKCFMETLAFLCKARIDSAEIKEIHESLNHFRKLLTLSDAVGETHNEKEIIKVKNHVEEALRKVMCRTERNWYIEDSDKGVVEIPREDELAGMIPRSGELKEYIQLREFLLRQVDGGSRLCANITDFWKSCPSIISFMDGGYALINKLRKETPQIPESLLLPFNKLERSFHNNFKFRLLLSKVLNNNTENLAAARQDIKPADPWKYLWIAPTYRYYKDHFFNGNNPQKYLIFSHWRFVPKSISYIVSHQVSSLIPGLDQYSDTQPLKFGEKLSYYLYDVCYPSLVLATKINPLKIVAQLGRADLEPDELVAEAEKIIKTLLTAAGVAIGDTRQQPLWQVMARVEACSEKAELIRTAIDESCGDAYSGDSAQYKLFVKRYLEWMDDQSQQISVSKKEINRLARIALFSPAVAVLRAAISVFPHGEENNEGQILARAIAMCMNALRHYFNRDICQAIINNSFGQKNGYFRKLFKHLGAKSSYTSNILKYCAIAHFQAVVDEYAYLVKNVLQCSKVESYFDHLSEVFGMYSGSPRINARGLGGKIEENPIPKSAHFALAFGEGTAAEDEPGEYKATRESSVREAFNSPFWPFVLATTSKGQEGLDFHLYCQDVVHWNLPSNPVDLEQREGRINRFDGFCIRKNISQDFELLLLPGFQKGHDSNIWQWIFEEIKKHPKGAQRFKHGLYPHWIYTPADVSKPVSKIRRHLLFYSGSRDLNKYKDLKMYLSLYRLAFGQPRQEDFIHKVQNVFNSKGIKLEQSDFGAYMINLSPITGSALEDAKEKARVLLQNKREIEALLEEVKESTASLYGCGRYKCP